MFNRLVTRFRPSHFPRRQLVLQLEIASKGELVLGEHQAMHERRNHKHACLGRGAANIRAVLWRDLVEVKHIDPKGCDFTGMKAVPSLWNFGGCRSTLTACFGGNRRVEGSSANVVERCLRNLMQETISK